MKSAQMISTTITFLSKVEGDLTCFNLTKFIATGLRGYKLDSGKKQAVVVTTTRLKIKTMKKVS